MKDAPNYELRHITSDGEMSVLATCESWEEAAVIAQNNNYGCWINNYEFKLQAGYEIKAVR